MRAPAAVLAALLVFPTALALGPATLEAPEVAVAQDVPPVPALPCLPLDLEAPLVVDECGDTMTGPLVMEAPIRFPGGDITGNPTLAYGGVAVCLAGSTKDGCISRVNAGFGLVGGGTGGVVNVALDPNAVWLTGGNLGTSPATNFLGTRDNQPLELRVNGARALRLEPNGVGPNVIGGSGDNAVNAGTVGGTVAGGGASGNRNRVSDDWGTVGGGLGNRAGDNAGTTSDRRFATVAGGFGNTAGATSTSVGGGQFNTAGGDSATVAGGNQNGATGFESTVGGGGGNSANGYRGTIGGGGNNAASGQHATVAGGGANTAGDVAATVAGGVFNTASAAQASVGGGRFNTASGFDATVPGGFSNTASGPYSFAGGMVAQALHSGSFVWADSRLVNNDRVAFPSTAANQFSARATGGVRFVSGLDGAGNPLTGVSLAPGSGSWSSLSDRAVKQDIHAVDAEAVLARIVGLPISTWSYTTQPGVVHMGPMAQDFAAAFGLGEDARTISGVDADGVALAAIQGLAQQLEEKDARIASLEARLAALEAALASP